MKLTDIDEQLNERGDKGLAIVEEDLPEHKGRWVSLWTTPEESAHLAILKMKFKDMGIRLPFSQILRTLANKGLHNIDWDEIRENPRKIFMEVVSNG